MEKVKDFIKKIFNSKNKKKSIIAIVALVECILLVGLATYSWIESMSSLVIKGEDLPINSNLNYRFDVKGNDTIDLSTYYRPTALYQLAMASTTDAQNFYFKKSAENYRLGDTTDYNTSYYNFDFQIHNESTKTYNYYFNKAEIFDITSDKITDETLLKVAEGAMRVAVTSGTTSYNTRIYSIDSKEYGAVNTKTGGTSTTASTGLSGGSQYNYQTNTDSTKFVFSTTGGGDDARVNIKIWFEERDPEYQALSADDKKTILGATVNINFQFVNAASNFQTFFFDDYTFSIEENHEGQPVTTEDNSKSLYFLYKEGTETQIIPMTTTTSDNGVVRWVTASEDGNAAPRISDDMRNKLSGGNASGYFFYGTYNASTGSKTETYKWPVTAPAVNTADVFIFKALSVIRNASGYTGYGVWDNVAIDLYKFKDMATCDTEKAYNTNSFQFINKAGQGRLYITKDTTDLNSATRLYYDKNQDIWMGYFDKLTETFTTPIFNYINSVVLSSANIKVQWSADNPMDNSKGQRIYTALGYEGTGAADFLSSTATGVGTWSDTEMIRFSTELVDASMLKDYRYKINTKVGGTYKSYYMALAENATQWKAYVPVNSGDTTDDAIRFQRFNSSKETQVAGTWNSTNVVRNNSSTYYATNMAATTSAGQWHIAVVVDGSADGIINDTLTSVAGSALEYSIDGGTTYNAMNQLDDHRWYTADDIFSISDNTVHYRWTAYPEGSANAAIFSYGHDLSNGIYFNITE